MSNEKNFVCITYCNNNKFTNICVCIYNTGLRFNKYGQSYGTVYDAVTLSEEPLSVNEPDLIYVLATNGKYGYAKKEDMYSCGPTSPDDTEWEKRIFGNKDYYEIDVFDSDGVTVIGKFRIKK